MRMGERAVPLAWMEYGAKPWQQDVVLLVDMLVKFQLERPERFE